MRSAANDEAALIGAAIIAGDGHGLVSLEPAEFESDLWAKVWAWMQRVKSVDPVALESAFIDDRHRLQSAVGNLPTLGAATNMPKIAKRIREAAHRRRVAKALADAHRLLTSGSELSAVGDCVIGALDNVGSDEGWKSLADYLIPAYHDIEAAQIQKVNCNFVPTGFSDFDAKFGGLQNDGLIVVAGRPGMGKSAFATALARNAAKRAPSLIMSLEMSGKQLAMRYFASEAGVCMQRMMQGNLRPDDWGKLSAALPVLSESGIKINENRSRTISDVIAEARRFKRVHGKVGLITIDYLTLLELPKANTKTDAIAEVTRRLTSLAGEIECPVVLLSQLNRDLEKRANKKPVMADLRDSGAIEQDASQIIAPFRPEVYDKNPKFKGVAILELLKNRNGSTGSIQLSWVGESVSFKDFNSEL